MADDAQKLTPNERAAKALDSAYDEWVSVEFRTLIENVVEANAAGATLTQADAVGRFAKSMRTARTAYQLAQKLIEDMPS